MSIQLNKPKSIIINVLDYIHEFILSFIEPFIRLFTLTQQTATIILNETINYVEELKTNSFNTIVYFMFIILVYRFINRIPMLWWLNSVLECIMFIYLIYYV